MNELLNKILKEENIILSNEQEKAVQMCMENQRVLVLGGAGTGKTEIIKIVSKYFERMGKTVCRMAPTGAAALKIDGHTIHKEFMISGKINEFENLSDLALLIREKKLRNTDVIIIDEISMLTPIVADFIFKIINYIKINDCKSIKVLCFGDLFQLPPVISDIQLEAFLASEKYNIKVDENFRFLKYIVFHRMFRLQDFKPIILHDVFRQQDNKYLELLQIIRQGRYLKKYYKYFHYISRDRAIELLLNNNYVFACGTNDKKNIINDLIVSRLQGEPVVFESQVISCNLEYQKIAEQKVILKENMRVMLLVNQYENTTKEFCANGQVGTIKKINGNESVEVAFDDGSIAEIKPILFEIKDIIKEGSFYHEITVASYNRIPLVPAYAMTIHKLQGATIDKMILYPKDIFDFGHIYVALSRVRSRNDLFLTNLIEYNNVKTEPNIIKFYEYIEKNGVFPDSRFFEDILKNALKKQLTKEMRNLEKREMYKEAKKIQTKINRIDEIKNIWEYLKK